MSEQVYFYQNNPCIIIRSVGKDFAEVRLSHHFAGDMELTGQCEDCNVGDSDNKLSCTCDEHSWIIEEIQEEENLLIVMVEKRLLTDQPIEYLTIIDLKKQIRKESDSLNKTKELHEEWRLSLLTNQSKVDSLKSEIAALKLSVEANRNIKDQSEKGLDLLTDKYNSMIVYIGKYSKQSHSITMGEYDNLIKRIELLQALEAGGVDNWEWFDESRKNAGLVNYTQL